MNQEVNSQTIRQKEQPTGLELDYLASTLGKRFIQRWDLFSIQRDDGRYICMHDRLHHDQLLEHLQGELTLGAYVLDKDSLGFYLVFDADDNPDWRRLNAMAKAVNEFEMPTYLEKSRRGGHLWMFFERALPGHEIRQFGQGLKFHFGLGSLELFPKQAQLAEGPGSLIRLPFGVHRRSGRRYGFYLPDGQPLASNLREQIHLLETPRTVPMELIKRFTRDAPANRKRAAKSSKIRPIEVRDDERLPLYEQIKQEIAVRDFVGQYVDLSLNGTGLCPFHNDHVDSFSIHDGQNYWKCFACGKSGSIIDFWMYYRDCDFKTAVNQLASMLL